MMIPQIVITACFHQSAATTLSNTEEGRQKAPPAYKHNHREDWEPGVQHPYKVGLLDL